MRNVRLSSFNPHSRKDVQISLSFKLTMLRHPPSSFSPGSTPCVHYRFAPHGASSLVYNTISAALTFFYLGCVFVVCLLPFSNQEALHAYVSDIPARRPAAAHQPMLLLYLLTWTSTPPVTLTGMTEPQSPESIKLRCSDPLAALLQQCSSDRDLQRVIRRAIRATLPHSTTIPQCRKLSNR